MKFKPNLDVVDFSRGFIEKGRVLYVPGAEETVEAANRFVQEAQFSTALLKNDTHFEGEYKHSLEAGAFPFHQGFGTSDHEYLLEPDNINAENVFWLLKNKFDMWAPNADVNVPFEQIEFASAEEKRVYQGLYKLAVLEKGRYVFGDHRDTYMNRLQKAGLTDVVVFGHATDYCVRDAVIGYLERGFRVFLIVDLCRGIWNTDLLGGVANLEELIERCPEVDYVNGTVSDRTTFKHAVSIGRLVLTSSQEYLAKYNTF